MPTIIDVSAREILDSRGNPTVEAEVMTAGGAFGRAAVPSGASTGEHEAIELRDGDEKRFLGKGVLKAVKNVNEIIAPSLLGLDVTEQRAIDDTMLALDDTENKGHLGANAILSVSMACARAAAQFTEQPLYRYLGGASAHLLPVPLMNVLNGGVHAGWNLDIQEFMIAPFGAPSFTEALRMGAEVYHHLKKLLSKDKQNTAVGDEGGFAPALGANHKAIEYLIKAIEKAGYRPGEDIAIALDSAASSFYDTKAKKYNLATENKKVSSDQMIKMYEEWVEKYPLISLEDGLAEDDWDGWANLTKALGDKIQLIGDDIFVTNINRLEMGFEKKVANSILIKLNQIGSVTETLDVITAAHKHSYTSVISHRSGETEDTFIADLAVALSSGQIKTGAPTRSERIAKYNQLIRIESELETVSCYAGKGAFVQNK